ncbi:MAG: M20/M25/M40 family metallo-hydrolase [Flavobacteriales bacterium]|nr:M20/M25/M40 family metallo-hydrolase [Flavobacteriales bacterium]
MDFKLLQKLIEIRGASGDESRVRDFIIDHVARHKSSWKSEVELVFGPEVQDSLILIFGKPKTAVYAHMDSIGFMVGYDNHLIKIGGPRTEEGYELVGSDSQGEIETELMIIEDEEGNKNLKCVSDRIIDRGTILTFKPNFREDDNYIQSPYLDNRLGVWVALELAKTMENGAIVFSTYEEVGGNSVGFLAQYLYKRFQLQQNLISDITWVTDGVSHGNGVAISMRDKGIPRRTYIERIISIAKESDVKFQLEVESAGGSDGSLLQSSEMPMDWCFIGAPENFVHTPNEKVHKEDIQNMIAIYQLLLSKL